MRIWIITVFIFFFSLTYGQQHIRELDLGNITPIWSRVVVDTMAIDSHGLDGTSHLVPTLSLRLNDSILIQEYRDSGLNYFDGSLFEMVNLKTGVLLWATVSNSLTNGELEFARHMFINESGNLEVLGQRRVTDGFFYPYNKSLLTVRKFDINTGQLLSHLYNPIYKEEEHLAFALYQNDLHKLGDYYIHFADRTRSYLYEKKCKRFDRDGNFVDSLLLSRPLKHKTVYNRNIYQREDGTLMTCRYSVGQDVADSLTSEGFDDNEFIIDYYNNDLQHTDSLLLKKEPPYNWRIILNPFSNEYLSILSYDSSFIQSVHDYFAHSIYNNNGDHIVTFDYQNQEIVGHRVKQIPGTNQFLNFGAVLNEEEKTKWIIRTSDVFGNIDNVNEIEIPDERITIIRGMEILKDKTIILSYYSPYYDENNEFRSISGLIALDPTMLGFSKTIETLNNEQNLIAYPNPFKRRITLDWNQDPPDGPVIIFDQYIKEVFRIHENQVNTPLEITLDFLPSGSYYLKWTSKDGTQFTKTLIKV